MQNEQSTATVYLNGEQAKSELAALDIRAKELRKSIKQASEIGDLAGIKRYTKELKDVSGQMKVVKSESFNAKKVLDDLSGATLRDLYGAQKKIDSLLRNGSVKRNSDEWKELVKSSKSVKTEISKVNSELSIGESRWSKMTSRLGMFLSLSAGFAIVSSVVSNAVNKIFEFSKAVSELSALTGATGKDLDFLKNKAKELGAEYGKSATEIVTAMKLVGSAKPELLSNVQALSDVTKSVLTLSKATGMDLSESTKNVTTIMNQFGISATESDRTINVLAAGSKFGAVEVDYLGESISKVGTISKSAGLSLEKTTAVMELFGEKGVKAETAGTGFKGVLVKLQADTKNYTNGLFDLNKAIDNNQKISGDNIALQKKFGTEFFGLAQILFQNKSRFEELTKQVTGTTVAEEQMLIATDNLSGDVDKMASSWDSFILSLEDGKGPIANASRWLIQLGKSAIDALASLTKSSGQKEADLITLNVNNRIKSLKEEISLSKDKVKVIDESIASERNIYSRNQAQIKKLKDEMVENDKKNFLMHSTQLDSANKKEIESLQKSINRSIAYVNAAAGLKKSILQSTTSTSTSTDEKGADLSGDKDPNKAKLEAIDKWISDEQVKLKNKRLKDEIDETSYQNKLVDITRKGLVKKQDLYKSSDKEHSEYQNQIIDIDLKRKMDANAVELKVLNDSYTDRQNLITAYSRLQKKAAEKDLEDDLITQDEYENKLLAIDKAEATSRLQSAKQLAASIKEFTFETEEAKKSAVENANKWIEKAEEDLANTEEAIRKKKISDEKGFQKEVADIMRKYGVNRQKEIIDEYNSDLFLLKKALDKKKLTLEQYEKAVAKIKAKVAQKNAEDISQVASEASALSTTLQDAQLLAVENKYAKELKAAKGNAEETTKIEEKIAAEKIEVQKEYADVNFAISIAQIGANTAVAIMKALADLGPIAGPIAAGLIGLTGLAQVAVAKQQRDEVKNLWTGGFTDPGDKYKPAGIVHAGEFVANQDAVRSAPMRKVFNLIDHAQKTNTVARITPEDISRAVGMKSGYSADNYSSPGAAAGANSGSGISAEDLAAMRNTMDQSNAVNNALLAELKKGIVAKSVISGNDGTAKKLEEYNKLISNAKG